MQTVRNNRGFIQPFILFFLVLVLILITIILRNPQLKERLLRFFYKEPTSKATTTYSPKVLLLIYNPILKNQGNQRLVTYAKWQDPRQLSQTLVNDFATASAQVVNYNIVETDELDDYPVKNDGFKYTDDTYLACLSDHSTCHSPDGANYVQMLNTVDACGKRNRGEIDEIWIWGGPWFGYWESNLAGPKAFWYNSSPTTGTTCQKLLPIMGFNYERGEAEALESYGHRFESTMIQVYGSWEKQYTHAWNKFSLLDVDLPGKGGCGNAHNAVNATSNSGYDRTNTKTVPSDCDDFQNYPNLTSSFKDTNCNAWSCTTDGYLKWWYAHIPHFGGVGTDGKLNNWWAYIVDPENTIANVPASTRDDKLVGYWKMDEASGSVVGDALGLLNGTAIGNATIVDGASGFSKARNFDGSNTTRVDLGDKTQFELTTFSISAWVYRKGNCNFNDCNVFSKGQSSNSGYALRVKSYDGGNTYKASLSIRDSLQDVVSASFINPNSWYHLVATADGSQIKLYVNGKLENQVAQTVTPTFGSETAKIGNGNSNIDLGFNGIIDEVAFWNRVLTDTEVSSVYNNGNGQDVLTKLPLNSPTPTPTPTPTPIPDTTGPSLTIIAPINGSAVKSNSKVTIQATTSDTSGIAKVEFLVNNSKICTVTISPYNCSWSVPPKAKITYTIKVNSFDKVNNSTSKSIQVTSK